jgi:tRNA (cmo5U34)-methyltransferase
MTAPSQTASIAAYEPAERVRAYDADMDVMHPLRHKMIDVIMDVLPFDAAAPLWVLDLGVGTGVLAERFLRKFTAGRVIAVDGSHAMLELAKSRLTPLADRLTLEVADFRRLPTSLAAGSLDAVISAYALHHLNAADKLAVLRRALALVKPGGWLVNADLVVAADERVERRIQQRRVEGIVSRARSDDGRFRDFQSTRTFLDDLEANEQDQPLTLEQDLQLARDAGLRAVEVFWKEYREVVYGGPTD